MKNDISLMFSGGIDSTYAAIKLTKDFNKIHLLTYSNGYGHFKTKRAKNRYLELKKRFPGKFSFNYFSVKDIFEKILINNLDNDSQKYSSGFIWCLGCKITMHSKTIMFNKLKGIKFAADGSSHDTSEMVEQSPFAISLISDFYKQYGIEFNAPVYRITREEKRKKLADFGFNLGIKIMDRHIGIQPKCIPGELYYSPLLIMGRPPFHQTKEVYSFYREKLPILKEHINNEIKRSVE
ncbi:hypothetical protein CL621_04470 [archaeon]|nr:hypothetical protein [archaeon]|tara:strand:- start:45 stop:755 length:711 start_codon:yes stop_codon:yes gene_type:complete